MALMVQAIRGMNDLLPEDTSVWQQVEKVLRETVSSYGYSEVRMPIVEKTKLFCRAIGEVTDVVEKEMYSFEDRSGDHLSLRPEGTAGCVRACIEHNLVYNQEQRLWYMGPMFRHERPQKGRYRQFHQTFSPRAFRRAASSALKLENSGHQSDTAPKSRWSIMEVFSRSTCGNVFAAF